MLASSARYRLAALAALALVLAPGLAPAATVYVPADEPTIQAGIDAAGDGGTVYVEPGTYMGEGNREIDFGGMNVTLESTGGIASTVIDCGGAARGFYFHTDEDTTSIVEGFTIRNCSGDYGGAIRCQGASPTIRTCMFSSNSVSSGGGALHADSTSSPTLEFCIFTGNSAQFGGAIYMDGAGGWVRNCSFAGNSADGWGGAVFLRMIAETAFEDCIFTDNTSTLYGAGVYSLDAESTFERCTFAGNEASYGGGVYLQSDYNPPHFTRCTFADNEGGGMWCRDAYPVITQTIFAFDRTRAGIYCSGTGEPSITHSFIFGNAGGDSLCGIYTSNRFEDPLFCGMQYGDLQLCGNSLCLPGLNPWGEHIGARMAGCPDCSSPVEQTTWGAVKSLFR